MNTAKTSKNILINSMLAFVSAFFITTIIHECGHFTSYLLSGGKPILFHNYVNCSNSVSDTNKIISLAAGPLTSFIQGIIFALIISFRKTSKYSLLYLWLSLLGFINFFGYLMLTSFAKAGDTSKIADILNLSFLLRILISIIGITALIIILKKMIIYFSLFIPTANTLTEKRKYLYCVIYYPIIFGSIINIIFSLPVPVFISLIYPATSSFAIMSAFGKVMKNNDQLTSKVIISNKIIKPFIFINLFLIVINRILTFGISI